MAGRDPGIQRHTAISGIYPFLVQALHQVSKVDTLRDQETWSGIADLKVVDVCFETYPLRMIVRFSVCIDGFNAGYWSNGVSWYLTWIDPYDTTSGRKVNSTIPRLDHRRQRSNLFRGTHQSIEVIEPFGSYRVAVFCKSTLQFISPNVHDAGQAVQPHIASGIDRDTRDTFQGFRICCTYGIEVRILQDFETPVACNPDSSVRFVD